MRVSTDRKVVLILSAKPEGVSETNDTDEINAIRDIFTDNQHKNDYLLEVSSASTIERIIAELQKRTPYIIHFIGHANGKGICVEQKGGIARLLKNSDLDLIFRNFSEKTYCLVLNACNSATQAEVVKQYIPVTIATNGNLSNDVAIRYSKAFYRTLCQKPFDELVDTVNESYCLGSAACDNDDLYSIFLKGDVPKQLNNIDNPDEQEGGMNTMTGYEIELLRLGRLSYWNSDILMRSIYMYPHKDANHFIAAIRQASERVNGDNIAFIADRDYLNNVLEQVQGSREKSYIYALIAALTPFRGLN